MSRQYVGDGRFLPSTSGSAIAAGTVQVMGSRVFISPATLAPGQPGVVATSGVWRLPKSNAAAWVLGNRLYWNGFECTLEADDGGDPPQSYPVIGYAAAPAAEAAEIGLVLLGQ